MTRDEILRMAREAQQEDFTSDTGHWFKLEVRDLERFARLSAAAEREQVAQWMLSNGYATGHGDTIEDLLRHLVWEEREQCAKVCEWIETAAEQWWESRADPHDQGRAHGAYECSEAIRARGSNANPAE